MRGHRESGVRERRRAGLCGRGVERAVIGSLGDVILEQVGRWALLKRHLHAVPHQRAVVGEIWVHTGSYQRTNRHRVGLRSSGQKRAVVHSDTAGD